MTPAPAPVRRARRRARSVAQIQNRTVRGGQRRSYVNARAALHAALSYCKKRIAGAMGAMETNELTSVRYLWGSQVLEEMKAMIKVLQDPSQFEP